MTKIKDNPIGMDDLIKKINAVIDSKSLLKNIEEDLREAVGAIVVANGSISFKPSKKWDSKPDMLSQALNQEGTAVDYRQADCRPGTGFIKKMEVQDDGIVFTLEDIDSGEEVRLFGEDILDFVPVAEFLIDYV